LAHAGETIEVNAEQGPTVELHVVSDATGETASRVVTAVGAQFPDQPFVTVRHPRVESVADLQLALARMQGRPAVAIFTVVEPTLREAMRELCREADIVYCDLLEQPLAAIAQVSGRAATMKPGLQPPLDEEYFRRIAAIEYAVNADDGLGHALPKADIVLVGVSRTSKTPLSMYLGYLGWKVANVPIVKGIDPPAELFEVDAAKIVGLTIDAQRLAEIRAERVHLMGGDRRYASLPEIYDELDYAAGIHRRLGCPVIDVSELSIEETAQRILRAVQRRALGTRPT
jgi:[pyruvate, water dikinase]-phosphate phosphotransferase / [pyruvate, water dikinase] kinase